MSKNTALRVLIAMIFACTIIGSVTTEANARVVSGCKYLGHVAFFSSNSGGDIDLAELMVSESYFPERRCDMDGARVYFTEANRHYEVLQLRDVLVQHPTGQRHGMPMVYCEQANNRSYLMGEMWIFDEMSLSAKDKRDWNTFARNWVRTHDGCRLSN